jgi:DNA-directed RNA polymerase specialized sigma24 family protein
VELAQTGDATASERLAVASERMAWLYTEAWLPVFRYAFLLLRHREDAEDATGEAFTRAHAAWAVGKGPVGAPLPWLLLITRRVVIDRQRRRRLVAWLPLIESHDRAGNGMTELANAEVWI